MRCMWREEKAVGVVVVADELLVVGGHREAVPADPTYQHCAFIWTGGLVKKKRCDSFAGGYVSG